MDTTETKKKRKREKDRARQRKCRAKKRKMKEDLQKLKKDLLIKNYKNRVAVRKHRSGIKHAGTRGKYKCKPQNFGCDIPATPADKREMKKIRYTDKNIIHHPKLLGLSNIPCKNIIVTDNGQQKIIYSDKDRTEYVGDTVNGKPHGKGTKYVHSQFKETYVGDFKNGKEHGNGRVTNKYVSYDGQWKNGEFHGEGIRQEGFNGVIIKGNWKKSCMHGKCTITIPKKCAKFEASFVYGNPKGGVKVISINKCSLKQYKNCALTVTDADSYYEATRRNKRRWSPQYGYNIYSYPTDSYIKGKFVSKGDFIFEDCDIFSMHGMVEITFEDGRRYSGMVDRDYFHGHGTYKWPDDYTFSAYNKYNIDKDGIFFLRKLNDHGIKLKELSGRFERGFVVEGKLKFNIGSSTASIEFEGCKSELWDLARHVIDWSINLPKLTRKCAMCKDLLYKETITYSTESQTIKTKEVELDRRGIEMLPCCKSCY